MTDLIFLKLGGSLLTDKTAEETLRPGVLDRLSSEIYHALNADRDFTLLIGHGSGSFGHVAAAKHGTRKGVSSRADWRGFAEVSSSAARLNAKVRSSLIRAGVPAVTFQPSASAICSDGRIEDLGFLQIQKALHAGLVPIVYGDVAIDRVRGGTIISTEEILSFIACELEPQTILLAGETEGVLDEKGGVIPLITGGNFEVIRPSLGGSRGTDVTGGMASKVQGMIDLVLAFPSLKIRIFSGLRAGAVKKYLTQPEEDIGTLISAG